MAPTFHNDDFAYLAWIRRNPRGFIVNCEVQPTSRYLILHRATCHTISGKPASGQRWTAHYKKVCAETATELENWAVGEVGAKPERCGTCQP